MKMYETDPEIYLLILMVAVGLVQSHPNLVNINEKLLHATARSSTEQAAATAAAADTRRGAMVRLDETGVCESISRNIHLQCPQRESGPKKWMHFNFPYICQSCLLHCTAAYFLTKDRSVGKEAYKKFRLANFYKGLLRAPGVSSKELHLNTVPVSITAPEIERGESADPGTQSVARNIIVHAASFDSTRYRSASGVSFFGSSAEEAAMVSAVDESAIILRPLSAASARIGGTRSSFNGMLLDRPSSSGGVGTAAGNTHQWRSQYSRDHMHLPAVPLAAGLDNRRGMLLLSADSADSGDFSRWRGIHGTPSRSAAELQQLIPIPETATDANFQNATEEPRARLPSTAIDMKKFHRSKSMSHDEYRTVTPGGNSAQAIPFRRPSVFRDGEGDAASGMSAAATTAVAIVTNNIGFNSKMQANHGVDIYRSKNQRRLQAQIYESAEVVESNHNDHRGMLAVGVFHEPMYVEYCMHASVQNFRVRNEQTVPADDVGARSVAHCQDYTTQSTIAEGSSIVDEHSQLVIDSSDMLDKVHERGLSSAAVKDGFKGAVRNIEYPPPHLRKEKDLIMESLFDTFFVPK